MATCSKFGRAEATRRRIAVFAATLILAAQFIGVSHWHRVATPDRISAHHELALDDGLCALCLLAFHSSFNPPATPALPHAGLEARLPARTPASVLLYARSVSTPTRAPPLAA